jgi:8-oxo-dGTP pyrophosphatase MutT (NUDIX family)
MVHRVTVADAASFTAGGLTVKFKQFAALPYRMRDDDVEILLITTRKKHRWSVPKGWPIKHSTPQTTAKIEAYEEAGVRGDIGSKQIGRFTKRGDANYNRCCVKSKVSRWR